MKRYAMTVNLETGAIEATEVPEGLSDEEALQHAMDDCPLCREERARTGRPPEPVFLSRPRPAPERPANWWHGRRKSTRRK